MSGFDEEAERERLREKYEQDQEKRAATQRMSELLLKGATMTNSHCDACGDPLFRHDGQTFCPTCQAAGGDATAAEATEAETAAVPETEVYDANTETVDTSTAAATRDDSPPAEASGDQSATADGPAGGPVARAAGPAGDSRGQPTRPAPSATGSAPLDDAHASLSRTLVKYARAAEEADDPRRATEFLTAAREAAETLAALDRR